MNHRKHEQARRVRARKRARRALDAFWAMTDAALDAAYESRTPCPVCEENVADLAKHCRAAGDNAHLVAEVMST